MGIGSNKSSGAGVVVSCVVLGIALLVVGATASKNSPNYCRAHCSGRQDQKTCYIWCMRGVRLRARGRTTEGEKAVGGIGAPASCRVRCRHAEDVDACVKRCQSGIEGEAARRGGIGLLTTRAEGKEQEVEERGGGGGAGLLAMPAERAGQEDREKKKQADAAAVQLGYDPEFCSFMCHYVHDKEDCLRKCEAGAKEARP